MAESDPPDGGRDRDGDRRAAPLRLYRGGRSRRARPQPASPEEVARRLSALERRVQRALGPRSDDDAPDLGRLADLTLAAVASARRMALADVGHDVGVALREALYRYWWRVEAVGLDRVPAEGRVLLVTNRGGALLPYEGLMLQAAVGERRGRSACLVLDDWVARLPVLGATLSRLGGVRAGQLRQRLADEEALILAPEVGQPKPFRQRYRLASFGRGAFARLAIETGSPVVPVAVIGAEEVHPLLARLDLAGQLLGLPTFPITPTFPWLGVAGLVPLPTKWLLVAGEPLDVAARHPAGDANDAAAVGRLRDRVRERLQALVLEGLRRRRSIFLG